MVGSASSNAKRTVALALFRNDLRVHDNPILHAPHTPAHSDVTHLMPLYVFDERSIELSGLPGFVREGKEARTRLCKFWRTGPYRARFLAEAVYDLRDRLKTKSSNLLIRFGRTEVVATEMVKALQAGGDEVRVFLQREYTSEESNQQKKLASNLQKLGVHLTFFDTIPLVDVRDLPFSIGRIPDVFTPFRKEVEGANRTLGRDPLVMPATFKPFPSPRAASINPSYGKEFDNCDVEKLIPYLLEPIKSEYDPAASAADYKRDARSAFPYSGGETSALARLDWYFHQGSPPPVARYKETRNGMLGHEYSTKFSPFLCLGMLSPRLIMRSLDKHEAMHGETDNTYWVRFELLWRDYFNYITRKYKTKLFTLGGFEEALDPQAARRKSAPGWWNAHDSVAAKKWMTAQTGVPFIDANIMELLKSGFMSNRGRQNVASFLTKDLQVDWRAGAEFFESNLIDYEPCANWGNWQYASGVGNDPQLGRQFNPIKQGNDYDPQGLFIKTWLPILASVPTHKIQNPWVMSLAEKQSYNVQFNGLYPDAPMCEQSNWKPHYNRKAGKPAPPREKNPGPRGTREGGDRRDRGSTRGGRVGGASRGRGGGGGRGE